MQRLLIKSVVTGIAALALCLAGIAQTPAAPGKFGLPAAKPAIASSATPVTASNAAPAPSSAPAPAAAPAPSAVGAILGTGTVKTAYMTAVSTKQKDLGKAKIQCIKYAFQPSRAQDAVTGLPTGRMNNGQVTITKRWDAASIALLQALENNESLNPVTLDFEGASTTGAQSVVFTVKLTNATVSSVHDYFDATGALEDVTFNFGSLEFTDNTARQTAMVTSSLARQ
jgi:type VI secretion system Hcp family effector